MKKTVVVTGASTGIGRATAEYLDANGFRVLAGVRKEHDADALRSASASIEPVTLDVTKPEHIEALAEHVQHTGLFGLVNNAGIGLGGPVEHTPLEDWRWQFEVNFFGAVEMTRVLLPHIIESKGRIVHIGSIGGLTAWPFMAPYHASKYALEGFSDSLRHELVDLGATSTVVEPGSIKTAIWGKAEKTNATVKDRLPPEARERYARLIAIMDKIVEQQAKLAVPPERVARVVHKVLTHRWPAARYRVGPDAHLLAFLKHTLPERMFEAFQRVAL